MCRRDGNRIARQLIQEMTLGVTLNFIKFYVLYWAKGETCPISTTWAVYIADIVVIADEESWVGLHVITYIKGEIVGRVAVISKSVGY